MNASLTSDLIDSNSNVDTTNGRTEVEIKMKVVLVNGTFDMPVSLESSHQRMAKGVVEKMNEKRIAEVAAKVLSLLGTRDGKAANSNVVADFGQAAE